MVFIFLVVYTDERVVDCISRLEKISDNLFSGEDVQYIIADTSRKSKTVIKENVSYIYPGNNGREFGGWEACLVYAKAKNNLKPDDKVIVVNDTFYSNYGDDYLSDFSKQSYDALKDGKAIYGYMDSFPSSVEINGQSFDSWVRTSFFITNARTLADVNVFLCPFEKEVIFSNDESFFLAGTFLSENYKKYLRCWLFENVKGDSEFNAKWHSAQVLTDKNLAFLQDKAMCILSEHYLTWISRLKKVKIIKVNK